MDKFLSNMLLEIFAFVITTAMDSLKIYIILLVLKHTPMLEFMLKNPAANVSKFRAKLKGPGIDLVCLIEGNTVSR
jgi:hypothetical protein